MADIITQEDLVLVLSQSASPQLKLRIEVLDTNQTIIGNIDCGITSGSVSISGESDIRRTASFVVQPTLSEHIKLTETSLLWLNKDIRMFVGLYNCRTKEYKYYPLGYYVYTDTSGTYDATTNNLTVNCSDFMKKLDGTKNGQLGALIISYPAYEENEETGEVIQYNIIRNAVIETLEKLAGITNHRIDDIGESKLYLNTMKNGSNIEKKMKHVLQSLMTKSFLLDVAFSQFSLLFVICIPTMRCFLIWKQMLLYVN